MIHLGDITKINGAEIPVVDVITGGSPCQDLSVAGKRAGLDGERSGLFMDQIRIVKEMRENDRKANVHNRPRPRYMVWENVPGAFSSNKGADFQAVLTEIVRVAEQDAPDVPMPPKGKWPKAGCLYDELGGWSVAWRVHDAQFWGVPQRRKRIALVADFGGLSAPEILFERKGLSRDFEPGETEGEGTAEGTGRGPGKTGALSFQERAGKPGGGKGILIQEDKIGALSTLTNQSVYGMSSYCSNAMLSDNPNSGTNRTPAVYDARDNGDEKTVCTLTGDHQNRVTDYTALCVGNGQLNQVSMAEQANTLDTMHDQQAVMVLNDQGGSVMDVSNENTATLRAQSHGHEPAVMNQSVVRRLTPLEAERLQGFPDGWTDIGEWVDSKGKKHKPADTPRYKALGNSIALPFWFWLLRRISAQYERPATIGSLFDGIGGFPLCWEKCNGKGTAVWASEIDEFCIAVTKERLPDGLDQVRQTD